MKDPNSIHTADSKSYGLADIVDAIPPLPFIVTFVLELTDKDDLSAVALAHAVEADPGLTARILRVSNSAFYSPVERVYTVRDAINYIGFETVRSLTVTNTIVKGLWVEDETFSKQMFWRHSLRCGLFAKTLAHAIQLRSPDILFTLGVLHDIGRAAIIQQDPKLYHKALDVMHDEVIELWQAEKKVLGYDHAEIGGVLAQKWGLPPVYANVIACHHEPGQTTDYKVLAHVIQLADALAHSVSPKDRIGIITPPLVEQLWHPLGLSEQAIRKIYQEREVIELHTKSLFETASLD